MNGITSFMANLAVLVIVAALIALAVRSIVRGKKRGGSCCGCSGCCAGCSGCGQEKEENRA